MHDIARRFLPLLAFALTPAAAAQETAHADDLVHYLITPQSTDSSLHRFNDPHYIVFERGVKANAPLLVFLPGTGGKPERTSDFANTAARQGYRAIGLSYVDEPAVAAICPRDPDPKCSEKVRQKRTYGDDVTRAIDDRREESIVSRLVKLLTVLQREHPTEGWADYLENGQPKWGRLALSGLSQGAGMAAFIAQKKSVARVILFSIPWDNYGPQRTLAPWVVAGHGATPGERWYGAYHEKEPMAATIARAYKALSVSPAQTRVFTLMPAATLPNGEPAYHASGVGNGATPRKADGTPAYLDDWRFLLGDVR